MRKKLRTSFIAIAASLNIVVIVLMATVGYAGSLNPTVHPTMATLTLAFPFFLFFNLCFLVFWLCVRWKWALLPIAGMVVCFQPVHKYMPVNIGSTNTDGAIKILSYNLGGFEGGGGDKDMIESAATRIMDYLYNCDADIICLQEAAQGRVQNQLTDTLQEKYQYYCERIKPGGGDVLSVFSRYPILRATEVDYPSKGNITVAYLFNIQGQDVVVVNNHLETNGLSLDDRANFVGLVEGNMTTTEAQGEGRMLFSKVSAAAAKRAPQAQAVQKFIENERSKGRSVIVCGDFNDNPLSYTVRTIGQGLTDCFVSTGCGPGWSYHKNMMLVRIDHIFCSDEWEPIDAQIDTKITASDHYPIYCWFKKRLNR